MLTTLIEVANMRPWTIVLILFTVTFAMTTQATGADEERDGKTLATYARPTGPLRQSRSVVLAKHGMVATSHPLAAQAGLAVLQQGGNAADAAIATCAVLGVVEPMSCGLGGDLFVIYWDNKTQQLYGINGSGRSPFALSRDVFAKRGLDRIPIEGPLAWSVPGCLDGLDMLRGRFGTRSWADLLAAAIATADDGFAVSELIAESWRSTEESLSRWKDSARTFLPDGRAPRFGEVFRNPYLAATLREIAASGADAFYRGSIAERIVAFSEANGGYFSLRDFAEHRGEWVEPVSTNYRGYDVWELPPNGQGIAALQMLNLLEPYDLKALGPHHPEYLHLLIEAKKLAFADRARFYADPQMAKVPLAELISKEYAERRRVLINRERAATDVMPGDPQLRHGDTVYVTVVDKDRNCCSLIQSNYYGFGSKIVPGDVGFALQNRGTLFALDGDHPNRLEPHKRPFHTIIPAMVTQNGQPWLCFGVMGGDMQPQGHVQLLVNLIDFGMNVQTAGDAARVRHDGSATPTGRPAAGVGTLNVEPDMPDEVVKALRSKGHQVNLSRGGYGGYQAIRIDQATGTLRGASEPRKDGAAVGY